MLLAELQKKRMQLKATQTVVTKVDGQKFLETSSGIIQLPERSFGFVVDTKPDNIPVKIIDYLYLGSQDCCDLTILTKYNINYVLSLGVEAPIHILHSKNIVYRFVKILDLDETNLTDYLPQCNGFIDRARKLKMNILVHCNAGVSRSSAICIAYLINYVNFNFQQAFELIQSLRPCIKPNNGFMIQLKRL